MEPSLKQVTQTIYDVLNHQYGDFNWPDDAAEAVQALYRESAQNAPTILISELPTVDQIAEVLRYNESSGMCHLGEVCDSCDCLSPKLHDDYARTHAAKIVELFGRKS